MPKRRRLRDVDGPGGKVAQPRGSDGHSLVTLAPVDNRGASCAAKRRVAGQPQTTVVETDRTAVLGLRRRFPPMPIASGGSVPTYVSWIAGV